MWPGSGAELTVVVVGGGEDGAGAATACARSLSAAGVRASAAETAVGGEAYVVIGGVEVVRHVAASAAAAPLLALTRVADRRATTELLDAGAQAVALLADPAERLLAALHAMAAGFVVVPADGRQAVRRPVFTARQKQILGLLVLGLSNAAIAERLILTEATVKTHLTGIFMRLGVRSRQEAVDVILDPAAGLGTGILGIAAESRPQSGYGSPTVK